MLSNSFISQIMFQPSFVYEKNVVRFIVELNSRQFHRWGQIRILQLQMHDIYNERKQARIESKIEEVFEA